MDFLYIFLEISKYLKSKDRRIEMRQNFSHINRVGVFFILLALTGIVTYTFFIPNVASTFVVLPSDDQEKVKITEKVIIHRNKFLKIEFFCLTCNDSSSIQINISLLNTGDIDKKGDLLYFYKNLNLSQREIIVNLPPNPLIVSIIFYGNNSLSVIVDGFAVSDFTLQVYGLILFIGILIIFTTNKRVKQN
jgi:hypothetical protein